MTDIDAGATGMNHLDTRAVRARPPIREDTLSAAISLAILLAAACAATAIGHYVWDVYQHKGALTWLHAGLLIPVSIWLIASAGLLLQPPRQAGRRWLTLMCRSGVVGLPPILAGHAARAYWQAIYGPAPMPAAYRLSLLFAMTIAALICVAFVLQRLVGSARAIRALSVVAAPALGLFLVEAVWSSLRPPFPGALKIAGDGGFITERLDEKKLGYPYIYRANIAYREQWGSNPRGYFDAQNGLDYAINGLGLRGPLPRSPRRNGVSRIVFLGDSFTFGEGVRETDTLPQQVAARLESAECVNGGVGGFDTRQEAALYRDRLAAFEPDVVVVVMGLNDRSPSSENAHRVPRAGEMMRLSAVFEALRQVVAARWSSDVPHTVHAYDSCFEALAGLRERLRPDQRLIVALYPYVDVLAHYPYDRLHDEIMQRLEDMGIETIDLLPVLRPLRDQVLTVHPLQDTHPNEVAHAAAAAAIAKDLRGVQRIAVKWDRPGEDE